MALYRYTSRVAADDSVYRQCTIESDTDMIIELVEPPQATAAETRAYLAMVAALANYCDRYGLRSIRIVWDV